MDENEYRNAYHGINHHRCVFEKSILILNCQCRFHERFNLAEREGIRCLNEHAQANCTTFLHHCREHARFALKLTNRVSELLPHNKEIQVQKGALLGLAPELPNLPGTPIDDIYYLIEQAMNQCSAELDHFDYAKLIPTITHHPKRARLSQRKNSKH